ncbi:glycine oxidase ThiO [Kocuria marina]|uniref:glycine oxidase ThiO n=1 Tax=Kocuria marina TaxID=223184 RepID=UPI0021A6E9C9|nr:glycine oxidase ThiO [Kocuria marina]MCT1616038.1 glycine oxidase ThiO [Kocuria marina]
MPEHLGDHVVVAGAGLVGLATAFELRRRGAAVTVVDPRPAWGATRAAAGMLAPIAETQYGQERLYPLMRASAAEYPDFVERVTAATGLPTGYRTEETLVVAADAADAQSLSDLASHQIASGMDVQEISTREARHLEPALAPRLSGAVRIVSDRQVDPRMLASALVETLNCPHLTTIGDVPDAGPAQWLTSRVDTVLTSRREPRQATGVQLDTGELIPADAVVVATGLTANTMGGLPEGLDLRLRPVFGDILRLRVPETALAPGESHLLTRTVRAQVLGRPVYMVPREDRTLVLGATSREDGRESVLAGGVHQLLRDARTVVPAIDDCDVLEMMARARPGTSDDLPYVGKTSVAGLVISTGHFRHGILLTPVASRLAAELVTGVLDPRTEHGSDAAFLADTDPARHSNPAPEAPFTTPESYPQMHGGLE